MMHQLMQNLGWGSGFRLPVANDENKALESLLEQKQRYLLEVNATLEQDTQHCTILKSHFERVSNAVNQSQSMINAKRSRVETEENLKSLSERMHSRIKQDFHQANQTIKDYQQRNIRLSNEIATRKEVVDDLIATVKFDQEALEKYKQVADEKEGYIEYMQSLTQLDDRVAKDFQLKFGQIGEALNASRRTLNEATMYTQTLQQQFSRLCTQFRRVHNERSQAISFWENTLRSMKQRDLDIKEVAEEYAEVRARLKAAEAQCERNRGMLASERNNAAGLEYHIKTCDKNCGVYRLRISEGKEFMQSLKDELLSYNTVINQTSRMVKDISAKIQAHEDELAKMNHRLDTAQKQLRETKQRYDEALLDTMTAEEKTREIEKMIDQEEQRTESILQEIERQRRQSWQRNVDLRELENKLKAATNQIKGTKTMITNLRDRAKGDDLKVTKKRQQAYQLELEYLSLESRIQQIINAVPSVQALPESSKEDIQELKDKLHEIIKTKYFLSTQESHLVNVNSRFKRDIQNDLIVNENLKAVVDNEKMEAKRYGIDNKKTLHELQNLHVEASLLKITLKRYNSFTQQARDKMFNLEQERLMVEAAASERRTEIDLHINLLKAQLKNLKDERSQLNSYIMEVMTEIERTKTRYDYVITAMSMGGDEGHSESYYILQHAKEKEALKQEGDLWDAKVKEAEKEIGALQNTLSVLVSSNIAFRDSLAPASADTPEAKMLADLEQEQKLFMVRKRKADKKISELQNALILRQGEVSEASHSKLFLEGLLAEKKYELNTIHFEVANQKAKIDRATKMAARLIRDLGLHIHEDKEAIELDLKLRCAREKFEFGLKTLEKTLFLHQELRGPALNFLVETELEPIIPRLRKRLSVSESNSPFHSGQVTPIRYLTPIASQTVVQPLAQQKHKVKLAEYQRILSARKAGVTAPSTMKEHLSQYKIRTLSAGHQSKIRTALEAVGREAKEKGTTIMQLQQPSLTARDITTTLFKAEPVRDTQSAVFDDGTVAATEGTHHKHYIKFKDAENKEEPVREKDSITDPKSTLQERKEEEPREKVVKDKSGGEQTPEEEIEGRASVLVEEEGTEVSAKASQEG